MEYNPLHPPEGYDFEIVSNDPAYKQHITLPTPAEPGVIITTMPEITRSTEDLRQLIFCSVYRRDVSSILTGAGMQYDGISIYPSRQTQQNWSRYEFSHPEPYNRALATLSIAQSDFRPPHVAVQRQDQQRAAAQHTALARREVAVNVHDAAVVADYEQRVPIWTFMCPTLFEAICQKVERLPVGSEHARRTMYQIDTLTRYEKLGQHIIDMGYGDTREFTAPLFTSAGFTPTEAIHLSKATEAYRRDVVRPLAKELTVEHFPNFPGEF
jgi:hypothetical protein